MALRLLCTALARRSGSAAAAQSAPMVAAAVAAGDAAAVAAAACAAAPAASAAAAAAPILSAAVARSNAATLLPAAAARALSTSRYAAAAAGGGADGDDGDDGEDLGTLLKRELRHEETTYEAPPALASGPPAPFALASVPGDGTVTLRRDYGGEEVVVDASVNMQEGAAPDVDDDDDDEAGEGDDEGADGGFGSEVSFTVTVTKAGESLVFDCASDGTYVDVRHVAHEPAGGADSETAYTGPVFDELADGLRDAFAGYLAERGVNEDLGEWLRHALYDKEQREYIGWLRRVGAFVAR